MNRQLNFEFVGHTYSMTFPNTGQYLKIHNLKASLAPSYDLLETMGAESEFSNQIVDAASHLTVLCPELVGNLKKPIIELDLEHTIKLVQVYNSIIRPWYNSVMNELFTAQSTAEKLKEGNLEEQIAPGH
jgi:hypothetical protein